MNFYAQGHEIKLNEGLIREEMWHHLQAFAEERGLILVELLCDGESLGYEDFLTVPEGLDIEVVMATPHDIAREVLQMLVTESAEIDEALATGKAHLGRVLSFYQNACQYIRWLSTAFPEWLADERMFAAASQMVDLLQAHDDLPPADLMSQALDEWTEALTAGVKEMDQYWRASREDSE